MNVRVSVAWHFLLNPAAKILAGSAQSFSFLSLVGEIRRVPGVTDSSSLPSQAVGYPRNPQNGHFKAKRFALAVSLLLTCFTPALDSSGACGQEV